MCMCVGGRGSASSTSSMRRRPFIDFSVFACRLVVVVDKESEFFPSSVDKIFCGGVPPPLVVVVRQPPLPLYRHYLFRLDRLHCLRPRLDNVGDDGRYMKIFTEPELMAGKGARTHARILDTHTMCKQTNVRKTVTENGEEYVQSSIQRGRKRPKNTRRRRRLKNNKTASQNAANE